MTLDAANPFASPSTLPYLLTPWAKVRAEHYLPAVDAGIEQRLAELQAVADNTEPPDQANVIDAWESSGQLLGRALGAFWTVQPADTTDELDAIDAEIAPKMARLGDAIYQNQALYDRVSALAGRVEAGEVQLDPQASYWLEQRLRDETGLLEGVRVLGQGSIAGRLWTKPTATVLGIDATPVADASNTLAPSARAKVSVRIAPDADPTAALAALTEHLRRHTPWGALVRISDGSTGSGTTIPFTGPAAEAARAAFAEAWGVQPVFMGQGGSIPMVADFQQAFPDATVLVTAVCDPDSRPHGIDESLHLGDFAKACLAEALLLSKLAE